MLGLLWLYIVQICDNNRLNNIGTVVWDIIVSLFHGNTSSQKWSNRPCCSSANTSLRPVWGNTYGNYALTASRSKLTQCGMTKVPRTSRTVSDCSLSGAQSSHPRSTMPGKNVLHAWATSPTFLPLTQCACIIQQVPPALSMPQRTG